MYLYQKKTPKYAPPPYTSNGTTYTALQHPVHDIEPGSTIVSNDIDEDRPDTITRTRAAGRYIGGPISSSNSRTYWPGWRLPTTFNLYYRPRAGRGREYFLASARSRPLNQVTFHSLRRPSVALHPDFDKSRYIATFNHSGLLSPSSQVRATGLVGGHTDIRTGYMPRTWDFTAQIGSANSGVVERFEWRHTKGHTVYYHLGAREGWKLVRLNRAAQAHSGVERCSDGAEVVAAFAFGRSEPSNSTFQAFEAFRLLSFAFVGGGATGELGEEWEVLAVMTALGIWHRKR